jgi:hypothetical protein
MKKSKYKSVPEMVFNKDCELLAKDYVENTHPDKLRNLLHDLFLNDPQLFLNSYSELRGERYVDTFNDDEYKCTLLDSLGKKSRKDWTGS